MKLMVIDGSRGEGGGQILRTSLALAALTGTPIRVDNIRAGRARPGLMRQHIAAIEGARAVCDGAVEGVAIGSTSIVFTPGRGRPGELELAVGTAGSTMLVFQTILPCLLAAETPTRVTLLGGTHNPMAPSFDFIDWAFLPALRQLGADVTATLVRPGFAPAGGGHVVFEVRPRPLLRAAFMEREGPLAIELIATLAAVPDHVALRELRVSEAALRTLGHVPTTRIDHRRPEHGPGNVLTVVVRSPSATEVVTAYGQRARRAEEVARLATEEVVAYLDAGAPVGPHLADQLILPMALGKGGEFLTGEPTLHTRTQIDTVRAFLDVPIRCEQHDAKRWHIAIGERAP